VPTLRTKDGRTLAWRELGSGEPLILHRREHGPATSVGKDRRAHARDRGRARPFGGPMTQEIAQALPNATQVTVPEADHFPFLEPDRRAAWAKRRAVVRGRLITCR